ncbi:MAG: hypothetical protein EOO38_14815 [Cytophagaceae bacterium]|nr:MAG: hypothetical protein EOO38_14815 [Cytophagaceae bacterium]
MREELYGVRDGFENKPNTTGGKLVFNLGDIAEDVIPDERYNFENGLPSLGCSDIYPGKGMQGLCTLQMG